MSQIRNVADVGAFPSRHTYVHAFGESETGDLTTVPFIIPLSKGLLDH